MKKFRIISLVLLIAFTLSSFNFTFAIEFPRETAERIEDSSYINQYISVIVELEENPLLDYENAQNIGAKEFIETEEAKQIKDSIIILQEKVKKEIVENINKNATFKYSYTNVLNGFSARVQRKDLEQLRSIKEIKKIYIDVEYEVPEPQMATANCMVSAPSAWNVGYKGEGTVVAVIDTGIDYTHELMVLSEDTQVKMSDTSYSDVLSRLNASSLVDNLTVDDVYYNRKFPYAFDYADKDSDATANGSDHGVHVAGIVAANGDVAKEQNSNLNVSEKMLFNGVAPEAQIIVMKVFSDYGGGAKTSDTLAAVEDAITLGVDAMNLSLGSTAGFTFIEDENLVEYGYEPAFARARQAGILVSVSAGNENKIGDESFLALQKGWVYPYSHNVDSGLVGSPGLKYSSTCVASVENVQYPTSYIYSPSLDLKMKYADVAEGGKKGVPFVETFDGRTLEYVDCGQGNVEDFEGKDLTDKLALIQRGEITFVEKVENAQACGAIGVIVYNNKNEEKLINMSGTEDLSIPSCFIYMNDGISLKNAATKTIQIDDDFEMIIPNTSAYEMSSFTSWGCTPDLKLKPEITAPGGMIYSTLPNNTYGAYSGTSMSAPNVAGGMALMQQYVNTDEKFADFTAKEKANIIENLLMSTAWPLIDQYNEEYSPRRQGAGLMDLEAAINSSVYAINKNTKKAKVELMDKIGDNFSIEFDLVNLSNEEQRYQVIGSIFSEYAQNIGPVSLTLDSIDSLLSSEMTVNDVLVNYVTTTPSAITGSAIVVAKPNSTTHLKVDVALSDEDIIRLAQNFENGFFIEGFIKLYAIDGQPDLSVPYMGFYGDWCDAPVMDGSLYYDSSLKDIYYTNSFAYEYKYDENGEPFDYRMLGSNGHSIESDKYLTDYSFISFSPNGDEYLDEMGWRLNLLRNAKELLVEIHDVEDNIVCTLLDDIYYYKTYYYSNGGFLITEDLPRWDGKDENGNIVSDGQYFYVIKAKIDYEGADYDVKYVPVKVDTKEPEITNIKYDEETKIATFDVSDNGFISYAVLHDLKGDEVIEEILDIPDTEASFTIDLSDFDGKRAAIVVGDCAGNESHEVVKITSTSSGNPTTPTKPTNPTASEDPEESEDPIIQKDVVVELSEDLIEVEIDKEIAKIFIDEKAINTISNGKSDILKININEAEDTTGFKLNIPNKVIDELVENEMKLQFAYGDIAMYTYEPTQAGELSINMIRIEAKDNQEYINSDLNFDIEVLLDGEVIENNSNNIKIEMNINGMENADKVGVYTIGDDGNLEYVMTYLNDDFISFYPSHFSPYYVMVYDKTFEDIENHWAKNYIESMASKHVVNGKTETIFAPDDTITRAEFVTMIVRALGLNGKGEATFDNMTGNEWYYNYMALAKDAGLIDGKNYNATGIISRVEMAKIASKAHAIINGTTVEFSGTLKFKDIESDSEYVEFIGYATENGLINGFPGDLYRPVENTTRAQAMTVIYKLINK